MRIRVVPVARGLVNPWSVAFLPTIARDSWRDMLVTEKEGRLRIVRDGVLDPKPIPGVPAVRVQGRSGLLDVLLHPQFAANRFIYFSYLKPAGAERQAALTVARGRFDGSAITDLTDIFSLRRGRQRAVADRVGARRQALYDDAERRERQQLAGSEQLRGQSAAPE